MRWGWPAAHQALFSHHPPSYLENLNTILWSIGTSMTHICSTVEGQDSDDWGKKKKSKQWFLTGRKHFAICGPNNITEHFKGSKMTLWRQTQWLNLMASKMVWHMAQSQEMGPWRGLLILLIHKTGWAILAHGICKQKGHLDIWVLTVPCNAFYILTPASLSFPPLYISLPLTPSFFVEIQQNVLE